jgi:hypothetical protein
MEDCNRYRPRLGTHFGRWNIVCESAKYRLLNTLLT